VRRAEEIRPQFDQALKDGSVDVAVNNVCIEDQPAPMETTYCRLTSTVDRIC
jgi:hypothetical protein